jgi:hypothetical protein
MTFLYSYFVTFSGGQGAMFLLSQRRKEKHMRGDQIPIGTPINKN